MKRIILSAAIASALAAAATAVPQERPSDPAQPEARQSTQAQAATIRGSVTSVDQSAKSFVVKDEASGKEVTVYWDSSTKVNGDLKPGSMVSLQTTDQGGKMMATSIDVKSAKKPY
jgi:hypothetical protein